MPYKVTYLKIAGIVKIKNRRELSFENLIAQTEEAVRLGGKKKTKLL